MLPFSATCSLSAKRCWGTGSALRVSRLKSTTRPVRSTCFRMRDDEIGAEGRRGSRDVQPYVSELDALARDRAVVVAIGGHQHLLCGIAGDLVVQGR